MTDAPAEPVLGLSAAHGHLSPRGGATVLPDFAWDPAAMAEYGRRFAADGPGGRLVMTFVQPETWTTWERHPAGEEVVVLLSGRIDLIQEIDGEIRRVPMTAGQTAVNPAGVWHTADVHEPGVGLFITPGAGTEHKPRG